jgi:hypothetical protein
MENFCICENPINQSCYMSVEKGCEYYVKDKNQERTMLDELEEYKDKLSEQEYNNLKSKILE